MCRETWSSSRLSTCNPTETPPLPTPWMFRIVTIAREHGSGGLIVAEKVSSALGWEMLDQSVVKHVADLARVPAEEAARFDECRSTWAERLSKSVCLGAPEVRAGERPETFGAERAQALAAEFIQARAASSGSYVIVGRGSQCILRGRPDTLKVFLHAPRPQRIALLKSQYPYADEAEAALERVDRARAAFVRHYFHCDWRDPLLYDLVINTRIGLDPAADLILEIVRGSHRTPFAVPEQRSA